MSETPCNVGSEQTTTSKMPIEIGEVEARFRYPVKSTSGELIEVGQPVCFEPAADTPGLATPLLLD